jgi:RNA recognition motif-containing protein
VLPEMPQRPVQRRKAKILKIPNYCDHIVQYTWALTFQNLLILATSTASENDSQASAGEEALKEEEEEEAVAEEEEAVREETEEEEAEAEQAAEEEASTTSSRTVLVENLNFGVGERALLEALGVSKNEIGRIGWGLDTQRQLFKGYCHVSFLNAAAAHAALSRAGTMCMDRPLRVSLAPDPPDLTPSASAGMDGKAAPEPGKSFFVSSAKPPGCKTVFVGNLDFNITAAALRAFFADCGPIVSLRWGEVAGEFKGFAHVEFHLSDSTDVAVNKSGTRLLGRMTKVDYARESHKDRIASKLARIPPLKPPGCRTVFVGGLPLSATSEQVGTYFGTCGPVMWVRLAQDKNTGERRGHGFVRFHNSNDTDAAVAMSGLRDFPAAEQGLIVSYSLAEWNRSAISAKPQRRPGTNALTHTVKVTGLNQNVTAEELHAAFKFAGNIESIHWSRKRRSAGPPKVHAVAAPQTLPDCNSDAHKNAAKTLKAALRAARPPKFFTGTVYVRLSSADEAAAAVAVQMVKVRERLHPVLPAADPEEDAKPKRAKDAKGVRPKLPHYHPLSSYSVRKRKKRLMMRSAAAQPPADTLHAHARSLARPADDFKLLG